MGRLGFYKILSVVAVMTVIACNFGDSSSTGPGSGVEVREPNAKVVCDPFGGDPALQGYGLTGQLYYINGTTPLNSVNEYFNTGTHVDATLYFNNLNTPTRPFDRGFVNQTGSTIVNGDGNTLYENFAINFESNIDLDTADPAGDYQLGVLSDDGTIIQVHDGVTYQTLINSDGVHPTRFGCATTPVHMGSGALPFKVSYYQGPRYHISLVMMWRPWPTTYPVNDVECGQSGNSRYFDSTQDPPTPQTAYNDLLSRGWKVMTVKNFRLPGYQNPCVATQPPVISNVRVVNVTSTSAEIQWDTDTPSTSQVAYTTNPSNGYSTTAVDDTMVTSHSVVVTGLSTFTFYYAHPLSKNASNQETAASDITFRTLH